MNTKPRSRQTLALLVAALLPACATVKSTYPPGATPITTATEVVGTWVSQPSQTFWAGEASAIRFLPEGSGLYVGHSNFSNQRHTDRHWTSQATFRHWQGGDTLRVKFNPLQTLSGGGTLGLRAGWGQETPVWLENGKLRLGRGIDAGSFYSRSPNLDGVDLSQYALSGGVNSSQRGTGAGFYDGLHATRDAVAAVHSAAAAIEQARRGGGGSRQRYSGVDTGGGGVVNGSFSSQEIQQMYGSSGLAVDFQMNRGKDVYRYYGIPKAQADQMLRSARTYTAAGHENVNRILRQPYRVQQGQTYKVGQEFVR